MKRLLPIHTPQREAAVAQAERRLRYVMERHGITRAGLQVVPHGLRHQDAADAYRSITGQPPPVAGGGAVDAALDEQARLAIAQHLGHGRPAIVNAYLGRPHPGAKASSPAAHPIPRPATPNPKEMNDVRDRRNPGAQPSIGSALGLGPGIDVPAREEILPGMRSARGLFHICDEHAEGAFVPTAAFMRNSPTWRLDVLGEILLDIQRAQQHAAVELFRELSRKNAKVGFDRRLHGFRHACERLGLVLPENVEGLIVLDRRFTTS